MNISGKVILITGGAGDIGQAFAKALLKRGSKVCICDVNEEKGKESLTALQNEFGEKNVMFIKCDVKKDEELQVAYDDCEKTLGVIDILINNAGVINQDWQDIMDVNYGGVVRGTELAVSRMGKNHGGRGGHVINIGSIAGLVDVPFVPFYAASKAAVVQYTRCAGNNFHHEFTGVIIQCLCPDGVESELLEATKRYSYTSESKEEFNNLVDLIPKLKVEDVPQGIFKLLETARPGEVLLMEPGIKFTFLGPPFDKQYIP